MRAKQFLLCRWPVLLVGLTLVGCGRGEQIERYTVRKPPPVETPAGPADAPPTGEPKDRTLAAIVAHGDQGWFFKLTGPKDPVAAQGEAFTNFLKTVKFNAEGKPEWTLPEGWKQQPGSDLRYATLVIGGEAQPLEISVISLPKPPGDYEEYALLNINRWRDQLSLPPIGSEQLASETTSVPLEGATATMVNLLGHAKPGGMRRPPSLPGAGNGN